MAEPQRFQVVEDTPTPEDHSASTATLLLALKALSQRALIAVDNLFTLITVGLGFYLWMVTPDPNDKQIISLSIYAAFTLAANWIVRRK